MRLRFACLLLLGCGGLPADGLATFKGSVVTVESDGENVYLQTNLEVIKVPGAGGSATTLVPEVPQATNYLMAVGGSTVDWVLLGANNTNTLFDVPSAVGAQRTLATLPLDIFPWAMTADASSVYLLATNEIWRVSKSDGAMVALATFAASIQLGAEFSIAVDASNVYWATSGNTPFYSNQYVNDGVVMSVPIGGGTAQTLASNQAYPGALAVDANNVYWMAGDAPGAACTPSCVPPAIMSSPIDSAAPITVVSLDAPAVAEIVVSDGFLYWISLLADEFSGDIVRAPVGGGTPEVVVAASEGVDSEVKFTVDATRIYWAGAMQPNDYLHWKPK